MQRLAVSCFVFFFMTALLFGDIPSLTLYDGSGNSYTSTDNTTTYSALPGEMFSLEIKGPAPGLFGLYMSLYKTPYPLNVSPPLLLLMPPFFPLEDPGPLDPWGYYTGLYYLPPEMASLGYDLTVYIQAYVYDATSGFQLTNGITLSVVSAKYKARVAYAWGTKLVDMLEMGERVDLNAADNELGNGAGLKHGGEFLPDLDLEGDWFYEFEDLEPQPEDLPDPSTSVFLNGIFPMAPGDVGFDRRFEFYPRFGSSPYIYARDRICWNNENKNLRHIIVPIFDSQGEKTHDLNIFQYKIRNPDGTLEYGFMALDVLNNDFYELTGTRIPATQMLRNEDGDDIWYTVSAWKPYVAISPDGRYMAIVHRLKRESTTMYEWKDDLYIVKLLKDDVWESGDYEGLHARRVTINNPPSTWPRTVTNIYAESMVFVGDPDPHCLIMITNRVRKPQGVVDPESEPPWNIPASMWWVKASRPNSSAKEIDFMTQYSEMPKAAGDKYSFMFFGHTADHGSDRRLTQLKNIRSKDNKTLVVRAAGRRSPDDSWSFDLLAFDNIQCDSSLPTGGVDFEVTNFTQFPEVDEGSGFYILPFGHCYNHWGKACMGEMQPSGITYFAFVTSSYTASNNSEDLYLAPMDGSVAGSLLPITSPDYFKGVFQTDPSNVGSGVFDPFFVDADTLVYFCGRNQTLDRFSYQAPYGDLFLYKISTGEYRNLTQTGLENNPPNYTKWPEPVPPFNYFGTILCGGMVKSPDDRYLFIFRESSGFVANVDKYLNLIGIDTQNDYEIFDITGSEFSQGVFPALDFEYDLNPNRDYWWGAEAFNVLIMPGEHSDKMFFTAKYYNSAPERYSYQVFMVNMNSPTGAYPVTNFHATDKLGMIDNLVVDPSGTYLGFSRTDHVDNKNNYYFSDSSLEDVYVVDISQGMKTTLLTGVDGDPLAPSHNRATIDGSLRFIPSESPEVPVEFIYGHALGGVYTQADNPKNARIWLYPMLPYELPEVVSYPLTEEAQFLLFNALPVVGE